MIIDFVPICELCDVCILNEDCPLVGTFLILHCIDWDDGYRGPEYFDADAWIEWKNATFFGEMNESTRPPQ